MYDTLDGFLEDQEMEATFLLIALVFLSLCHKSDQCFPEASKTSQGGFPIYFSFSPTPSPSSQDFWGFEGSIFKAKPEYLTPRSVEIHWINFMEGDDVRDGTAFKMTTESNDIYETNFKISVSKRHYSLLFFNFLIPVLKMNLTAEEFDQSITMHPKILERFSRDKTTEEIEEIKNFRLAIGFIIGTDFPGGSTQGPWSVGPNDEKAWADRFAVFYKNGTKDFGRSECAWYNQLPQGFSCGKGSIPIQECNGGFERFVPVPCNEIVLKVVNKEHCPRDQIHYGPRDGGEYNLDDFDGEDCFAGTNYT